MVTRMQHAASQLTLETDLDRLATLTTHLQPLGTKLANDLNAIG